MVAHIRVQDLKQDVLRAAFHPPKTSLTCSFSDLVSELIKDLFGGEKSLAAAQTGAAPAKESAQGWKRAIPFVSHVSTTSFASQNVAARFRPAKLRGSLFTGAEPDAPSAVCTTFCGTVTRPCRQTGFVFLPLSNIGVYGHIRPECTAT